MRPNVLTSVEAKIIENKCLHGDGVITDDAFEKENDRLQALHYKLTEHYRFQANRYGQPF